VKESNQVRYDEKCSATGQCQPIEITVSKTMKPPIYMYYQLTNYYQNHRRYVKSRSDQQLDGSVPGFAAVIDCEPLRNAPGIKGKDGLYFPCGLVANSWFNDTIELYDTDGTTPLTNKSSNGKGIAWPSDKQKFKSCPTCPGQPPPSIPDWNYTDIEDESFIVWMRTAGLPKFRKLHRIIHVPLPGPKTYYLNISNHYPVHSFGGTKSVILSTTTWLGGKNPFLGWAYIVTGLICIILGCLFLVKHKNGGRPMGSGQ